MNSNLPKVLIVIPNKSGKLCLEYSLPSLFRTDFYNMEVILVDNVSTDDSVDFVKTKFPAVTVIKNNLDRGFAGGVNIGIKEALSKKADYIAIFSNDIEVHPQWINVALEGFRNGVGIVGFMEMKRHEKQHFADYKYSSSELNFSEVKALKAGCLYVCSASLFNTIGLYDESYYMYGEDNDFFCRTLKHGFTIAQSNFPVWHYGEGFSEHMPMRSSWFAYRNALKYVIKNGSFVDILIKFLSLTNQGCNPFLSAKRKKDIHPRMRKKFLPFNLAFLIGSCFWNLFHLPNTLYSRHSRKSDRFF